MLLLLDRHPISTFGQKNSISHRPKHLNSSRIRTLPLVLVSQLVGEEITVRGLKPCRVFDIRAFVSEDWAQACHANITHYC